jgi:thiamine-monophosphate kinase
MGGVPRYAVISLGLPRNLPLKYVDAIYRGLSDLARRFGINIVGGDTNRSDKIVIDIALIGFVEKDHLVLRNTAKARDFIFVTGALGGSIRGRHLKFIPRLAEARALVEKFKVSSMIDLSDGLAQDLNRLTKESNVGAIIYEGLIPLHREAKSIDEALYMGEDFELLFTLPLKEARRLLKRPFLKRTKATYIGQILDKRLATKIIGRDCSVRTLKPKGFRHF